MIKKQKGNRSICLGDRSIAASISFDKNVYSKHKEKNSRTIADPSINNSKKKKSRLEYLEFQAEINKKLIDLDDARKAANDKPIKKD